MKSDVKSNEVVSAVGGVAFFLPTEGKELVLTPDKTFTDARPIRLRLGRARACSVKYSDRRFVDDMNTATLPDYTTLNFDARIPVTFNGLQNTYLQFVVSNITNTRYPTRVSSITNANNVVVGNTTIFGKTYFYAYDSPRTFELTLHAQF